MMPRVQPNDEMKCKQYKSIECISLHFECVNGILLKYHNLQQCIGGWVFVRLKRNQNHNASLFDHSNVIYTSVVLNSTKYTPLDANANFTKYQFAQYMK